MVLQQTLAQLYFNHAKLQMQKIKNVRPVISQDFSLFQDFFKNLPLPQNFLERREVTTKERKNCLYCVQTSSFLFVGMWRVCKSSKIKHPGGSQARYPFYRMFYFCQITPLACTKFNSIQFNILSVICQKHENCSPAVQ